MSLLFAAEAGQVHLTSQTRIVAAVLALVFMLMILELIRRFAREGKGAIVVSSEFEELLAVAHRILRNSRRSPTMSSSLALLR